MLRTTTASWVWTTGRLQLSAALVVALLLSLFASDLLARPAARSPDEPGLSRQRRNPLARNVEWIGMNLGGGVHHFDVEDANWGHIARTQFSLKSDLLLFNLHWPRIYWTVLELHPTLLLGYFGGGTRLGARIAIADDLSHELRCGAYLGLDLYVFHINAVAPTLAIGPHAEYVYNTRHGSVGLGIEVPINFHFDDEMSGADGRGVAVPPALIGVALYFRWSVWRMTW